MSEEEAIKIVEKFNEENKYRDCGKINNAIDIVIRMAKENIKLKSMNGFNILDVFNMGKESSRQRIKHDWVEKEKIREKLKEEQERIKHGLGEFYNDNLGNSATRILKELLGE